MLSFNRITTKKEFKDHITFDLILYTVLMLGGVILRTYMTHSVTIVWVVNAISIFVCFFSYLRHLSKRTLVYAFIYFLFCLITLFVNSQYITRSLKSIGTNINIIIPLIYLAIIHYSYTRKPYSNQDISKLLNIISLLGIIAFLFTWIVNFGDLLGAILGRIRIYRADIDGFFYNKNIYGAFISLSLAADLYLYGVSTNGKRIPLIVLKIIAIALSFSRAALLQAGIMIFTFLWTQKKHKKRDFFLLICFIILLIVIVFTNESIMLFIRNSILRVSVGDAGRSLNRKRALEVVGANPLSLFLGVGFFGLDYLNIDIDNTYLYLLFTGGIVKIVFFIFVLVFSAKRIKEIRHSNSLLSRLSISVFLSYLAYAFFESVAILELGLLNFLNLFYILLLPSGYSINTLKDYDSIKENNVQGEQL
ncbi:MAG: hypothetical protein IJK47_07760 [Lachnospiraceae bacterium]|nr:hypothetical protein [Lachnospiraceae bacterium]